jgi:hypothetical protein
MFGWFSEASTRASRSNRASAVRVVGKGAGQHLERDLAAETAIDRAVDLAHAAAADQGDDIIGREGVAGRQRVRLVGAEGGAAQRDRAGAVGIEERVAVGRLAQDPFGRVPQRRPAGGHSPDEGEALGGRAPKRCVEQRVALEQRVEVVRCIEPRVEVVGAGRHAGGSAAPSSGARCSRSHARALYHSRCTVRTDVSSASAVSCSLRPAK